VIPRLLARGVAFHEYDRSMMHAKLAVFDGAWAIIGTSNLDRQSFDYNFEVNLIVEGGEIPERLRRRFREDLEAAHRIDLESLAARSLLERFLDRMAALLIRVI
jgi:cardiolipin synthase